MDPVSVLSASSSPPAPAGRIVPSVSSPSLLAREPRPAQSKRSVGPKPFLLRSTTPVRVPSSSSPSTASSSSLRQSTPARDSKDLQGSRVADQAKLPRSKTETCLNGSASNIGHSPPSLPSKTKPRSSPRAMSTRTASSPSPPGTGPEKCPPIRASRKIVFVPDPSPSPTSTTRSSRRTHTTGLSTTTTRSGGEEAGGSAAERVQAVEKRKMELKRESLLSRKNGQNSVSPLSQAQVRASRNVAQGSENIIPDDKTTISRRWSLRPVRDSAPRRATSGLALGSALPESPSPAPVAQRDDTVSLVRGEEFNSPTSKRMALRGPAPPVATGSTHRSHSPSHLRKTESYAELSRVSPAEGVEDVHESDFDRRKAISAPMKRSQTGYTSLQDVLAERGYQDTRVLTPVSKARNKEATLAGTSALLAPPAQTQVKEKSSMLSLRGLFSLWGSDQPQHEQSEAEIVGEIEEVDDDRGPSSPNGSGVTVTHSPITRAREWVQGVAIATARDQIHSTTCDSTSFTPPFQYSLSTTEDSPASSRSYSSSIVTASSVRSPPRVTIALPACTVAFSPPSSSLHRFPPVKTIIASPSSQAVKSLRHAVSDSTLPQLLPHYTSFPFSPSSLDSDSCSLDDYRERLVPNRNDKGGTTEQRRVHLSLPPQQNHPKSSPSPQLSTLSAQGPNGSTWISTSLRHRASSILFAYRWVGIDKFESDFPNSISFAILAKLGQGYLDSDVGDYESSTATG